MVHVSHAESANLPNKVMLGKPCTFVSNIGIVQSSVNQAVRAVCEQELPDAYAMHFLGFRSSSDAIHISRFVVFRNLKYKFKLCEEDYTCTVRAQFSVGACILCF